MVRRACEIVMVSHYFPPHIGGIEMVAEAEAHGLTAAGHNVTVITSKVTKAEQTGIIRGIHVIRIRAVNVFEKYGIPFPVFSPRIVFATFRRVKQSDIVHIHDSFYISSLVAGLAARVYKKPLILTQHVDFVSHPNKLVGVIERMVYTVNGFVIFRSARRTVVINDRIEQFLMSHGMPSSRIVRLLNGVDTTDFRPVSKQEKKALRLSLGLEPSEFIVLFVGRYTPKKGYDKVLSARDANYHLVFAGSDSPSIGYKHTTFMGKVPHEKMADLFRAADAFVLPSHDEGFPLTVQEAMATGLPVITSDDPGYTTYMLDRDCIWLIKNPSANSLKAAITKLQADETQRKKMSRYSRQYALKHFSWDRHVHELMSLYESAISEGVA